MLKKTLMTAAAAVAITSGATALTASDANAGYHFKKFHHGYHHFHKTHCYTKYKKVKVKIWTKYGPVWKWKIKPVYVCH